MVGTTWDTYSRVAGASPALYPLDLGWARRFPPRPLTEKLPVTSHIEIAQSQ